jgi:hypothetical protein
MRAAHIAVRIEVQLCVVCTMLTFHIHPDMPRHWSLAPARVLLNVLRKNAMYVCTSLPACAAANRWGQAAGS